MYKNFPSIKWRNNIFDRFNLTSTINELFSEGLISEFEEDTWEKIFKTNIPFFRHFGHIFSLGLNLGHCGITAYTMSFIFKPKDFLLIEYGMCPLFVGTENCINGEHSWLVVGDYIYDTSFILKIHKDVASSIFRYNPISTKRGEDLEKEEFYPIRKEMALDQEYLQDKNAFFKNLDIWCESTNQEKF